VSEDSITMHCKLLNKIVPGGGVDPVGGGRISREGEGRCIWWMYFVFVYENRTMKLVKIVLRSGG
jgi:hypothetical protein